MSIIVDESTDLKSMTDDELIQILIDCDFSTSEISRRMGKFLVYATRIYRERGIQYNEMRKNHYKSIIYEDTNHILNDDYDNEYKIMNKDNEIKNLSPNNYLSNNAINNYDFSSINKDSNSINENMNFFNNISDRIVIM